MDHETKLFLGRILGEMLVVKARLPGSKYTPDLGIAYGLLNGFETTIATVIDRTGFIAESKENVVVNTLLEYFNDPAKLDALTGYYHVEHHFSDQGVDRTQAIKILKKLLAEGRFEPVIERIHGKKAISPSELHNLVTKLEDL